MGWHSKGIAARLCVLMLLVISLILVTATAEAGSTVTSIASPNSAGLTVRSSDVERRDDYQVTCVTTGYSIASSEFLPVLNQFCDSIASRTFNSGDVADNTYLVADGKIYIAFGWIGSGSYPGSFGGNDNCQTAYERILQACDQNQDTKHGGMSKDVDGGNTITLYIHAEDSFDKHTAREDVAAGSVTSLTNPVGEPGEDWGICWPSTTPTTENEFQSASDLFCNFLRGLPINASDYPTVQSYPVSSDNVLFVVDFNSSDSSGSVTLGFDQCWETTEKIRTQCHEQDGQHGGRWFLGDNGGTFELAIYTHAPSTKTAVKRDTRLDHARVTCWSGQPSHSVDDVNQAAQSWCTDLWPQVLQSQGGKVWKAYPVPGGDVEFRAVWNPTSNGLYTTTASCVDHINTILQGCDQGTSQTQGGELNVTSSNGFLLFDIFTTLDDRKPLVHDVAVEKRHSASPEAAYYCYNDGPTASLEAISSAAEPCCIELARGELSDDLKTCEAGGITFGATYRGSIHFPKYQLSQDDCGFYVTSILQTCEGGQDSKHRSSITAFEYPTGAPPSRIFLEFAVGQLPAGDPVIASSEEPKRADTSVATTQAKSRDVIKHEGDVTVQCGNMGPTTSADSIFQTGGQFCASVINHPWNSGQVLEKDFSVNSHVNLMFHMQYNGPDGALLSGATCQSWLQILASQCPYHQGGGVVMKTWTMFVGPFNGPTWAQWAFSKQMDPSQSKTVNIGDFNGTSPGAGNYSGTAN